jgi:hypothetical protein
MGNVRTPASEQLTTVATNQEAILAAINTYKPNTFEYSETNPNALSDGDEKGRGETTTIGTKVDILTRSQLSGINQYTDKTPYTTPV